MSEGNTSGVGKTVLVVDDDDTIRGVVRSVLVADGFDVVEAADGPAALLLMEAINGRGPDMVVLDVMMPGIDGIEPFSAIELLDALEDLGEG
jgi:CheY-like chemotaxis protein